MPNKELYQMNIWWREGELETKDVCYVVANSIAEVEAYAENTFMPHYWDAYNGNRTGDQNADGWWTYDTYRVAHCASVSKAEPVAVYDTDGALYRLTQTIQELRLMPGQRLSSANPNVTVSAYHDE